MRRHCLAVLPGHLILPPLLLLLQLLPLQAEIAYRTPLASNRILFESSESSAAAPPSTNANSNIATSSSARRCPQLQRYHKMLKDIDDVEDLYVDVPVRIAFEERQKKRFLLNLNISTPLTILFSAPVGRKMYYNQTANVLRPAAVAPGIDTAVGSLVLPCALRGHYDLFVQARQSGALKVEAIAKHPQQNWPLLNSTHRISIRTQNRVRKRQMIVKWEHSKFDYHAMHYCLVIQRIVGTNEPPNYSNFCEAVNAYVEQSPRSFAMAATSCSTENNLLSLIWSTPAKHERRLNPRHNLHIVCTGKRRQQTLRRLLPKSNYRLDLYGVHQNRQNLTMLLGSTQVSFNRTHPTVLRQQALSLLKIDGQHGAQIYSFKVPDTATTPAYMRHLLLPCFGSEIRVRLLRQRKEIAKTDAFYCPTYIRQTGVKAGERYLMRFEPSNEDETLRAQKVLVALSSEPLFRDLPELPSNITVFNVRTRCNRATIAWNGSPDERALSYCIIVFNLPQRNRSVVDYTNYCMDFTPKRVMQQKNFVWVGCREKQKSPDNIETETILNLIPGSSYLVYVTANLSLGKPLPYQTLTLHMASQCLDGSHETYY
ncbi:protein NDNF [Drosophila tropicalis]|uniref:protein NDNF n=1 Tax=Drosophila tropicalis TaxID=46794 RepID=UPI0035ABF044